MKLLEIGGLIIGIAYMSSILYTWIIADMQGYTYFMVGEPVAAIKYIEWLLGALSIMGMIGMMKRILDEAART